MSFQRCYNLPLEVIYLRSMLIFFPLKTSEIMWISQAQLDIKNFLPHYLMHFIKYFSYDS